MVEMIHAAALAAEFDAFLFASIGEERNGMLLSVVSALARLNVDPWQEAADLARLPTTTATRRLTSLIAGLPNMPSTLLDPATNAARLIAHLPRRLGSNAASAEALRGVNLLAAMQSRTIRYMVLVLMVVLGALGIAAGRSAAGFNNVDVPATGTVIPPMPSASG
jgi:hypothetical protein